MFLFGVIKEKPTRAIARRIDRICRKISVEEGETVRFIEVNVEANECPGINHGEYQGWFRTKNYGSMHNHALEEKVRARIQKECGITI